MRDQRIEASLFINAWSTAERPRELHFSISASVSPSAPRHSREPVTRPSIDAAATTNDHASLTTLSCSTTAIAETFDKTSLSRV